MLGLLQRVTLGTAAPQFREFIYPAHPCRHSRGWAYRFERHSKQLHDPIDAASSSALKRSLLALIYTYNILPQAVVDIQNVPAFQKTLQRAVKFACWHNVSAWDTILFTGAHRMSVRYFQELFNTSSCSVPNQVFP